MENISIDSMRYDYINIHARGEVRTVRQGIHVDFRVAGVECKMYIPMEDVRGMYEDEIQRYIYNHMNMNMERKFIDEI